MLCLSYDKIKTYCHLAACIEFFLTQPRISGKSIFHNCNGEFSSKFTYFLEQIPPRNPPPPKKSPPFLIQIRKEKCEKVFSFFLSPGKTERVSIRVRQSRFGLGHRKRSEEEDPFLLGRTMDASPKKPWVLLLFFGGEVSFSLGGLFLASSASMVQKSALALFFHLNIVLLFLSLKIFFYSQTSVGFEFETFSNILLFPSNAGESHIFPTPHHHSFPHSIKRAFS